MRVVVLLLVCLCIAPPDFAQSRKQRLVGEAYYYDHGTGYRILTDSLNFNYSDKRHSRFDYSPESIWRIVNPWNNAWTNFYWYTILKCNNIDSALYPDPSFDEMNYYHLDSASVPISYKWSQQNSYLLNGMHAATRSFNKLNPGLENEGKQVLQYNAKGGLEHVWVTLGNSATGNFDTFLVRSFFYDSLDRLVLDTCTRSGYPFIRNEYTYNSSGQYITKTSYEASLSTGLYGPGQRFSYQYYPDGRVKSVLVGRVNNGTNFVPMSLDSFGYTPGIDGYTSRKTYTLDSAGYPAVNFHLEFCHINNRGQRDTITEATLNGTTVIGRLVHVLRYNNAGNPISIENYAPAASSSSFSAFYYYYEDYDPSLSTQEVTNSPSFISLSPNPVSSTLTLHYKGQLPNTPITVSISNTVGQLVHQETFIPKGDKTDITLGDDVAPGLYTICVLGSGNSALYKGTFLKR